jgi:hypothetical protein
MIPITPAEIALLLPLIQQAIALGESVYEAWQLKDMAALEAKLAAQLETTTADRKQANDDIDARDAQLEKDLAK